MPYLFYAGLSGAGGLAGCAGMKCPHKPSDSAKTYPANDLSSLLGKLVPYMPYLLAASTLVQTYDLATTERHIPKAWLNMNALGCSLALIGGGLRWLCYRALGKFFTFQLAVDDGQKVVKSGPYALVRHPAYTASIIAILGQSFVFFGPLHSLVSSLPCHQLLRSSEPSLSALAEYVTPQTIAQAALSIFAFVKWNAYRNFFMSRIPNEEVMLATEFGQEWDDYTRTTPYKLFPYLY